MCSHINASRRFTWFCKCPNVSLKSIRLLYTSKWSKWPWSGVVLRSCDAWMSLPKAPDVGQTNKSDTLQDFVGTGPFCLQPRAHIRTNWMQSTDSGLRLSLYTMSINEPKIPTALCYNSSSSSADDIAGVIYFDLTKQPSSDLVQRDHRGTDWSLQVTFLQINNTSPRRPFYLLQSRVVILSWWRPWDQNVGCWIVNFHLVTNGVRPVLSFVYKAEQPGDPAGVWRSSRLLTKKDGKMLFFWTFWHHSTSRSLHFPARVLMSVCHVNNFVLQAHKGRKVTAADNSFPHFHSLFLEKS